MILLVHFETNPTLEGTLYIVHGTLYKFLLFFRYQLQRSFRLIQNIFLIHQLRAVFAFHIQFLLVGVVLAKAVARISSWQDRNGFFHVLKVQ